MSNLLAEGIAFLTAEMERVAAETVTYRRGATSVAWHATIGRQLLRTTDAAGVVRTALTDRDFTGPVDELSSLWPPREGDQVIATLSGATKTFTLRPIGTENCWRYSDEQGETSVRVHTKQTGAS